MKNCHHFSEKFQTVIRGMCAIKQVDFWKFFFPKGRARTPIYWSKSCGSRDAIFDRFIDIQKMAYPMPSFVKRCKWGILMYRLWSLFWIFLLPCVILE